MEPLATPGADDRRVAVVIPTLNEEAAIAGVIAGVPRDVVREVIVVDSGSTDHTREVAAAAGARVLLDRQRGYGRACAMGAAAADPACSIIVYLDGDGSDRPALLPRLVAPLLAGTQDFVIASRTRGRREPGSMSAHQVLAGELVGLATRVLYGVRYTDMCAFRAIGRNTLASLSMAEMGYGWNLEMQMKAARRGLRILELPVDYGRRVGGQSKVAGSLRGTLRASRQILSTFLRIALTR